MKPVLKKSFWVFDLGSAGLLSRNPGQTQGMA